MSTLFGHKKGAYTGAQSDRPGLLREANKGLLFLDEIGELGVDEQAMLLRAIEEGVYLPEELINPLKASFNSSPAQIATSTKKLPMAGSAKICSRA